MDRHASNTSNASNAHHPSSASETDALEPPPQLQPPPTEASVPPTTVPPKTMILSADKSSGFVFVRALRECQYGSVNLYKRVPYPLSPTTPCTVPERGESNGHDQDQGGVGGGAELKVMSEEVVIKELSKEMVYAMNARSHERPLQEVSAMQLLGEPGHMNVMRPMECLEDETKLYIVMPFYDGDLLDLIGNLKHKHLNEHTARHVFIQLIR